MKNKFIGRLQTEADESLCLTSQCDWNRSLFVSPSLDFVNTLKYISAGTNKSANTKNTLLCPAFLFVWVLKCSVSSEHSILNWCTCLFYFQNIWRLSVAFLPPDYLHRNSLIAQPYDIPGQCISFSCCVVLYPQIKWWSVYCVFVSVCQYLYL